VSGLDLRVFAGFPVDEPLYAVLDGARDKRVADWATKSEAPAWCLYAGDIPAVLAQAAPWLLRLGRGHAYTTGFFEQGWNWDWGIVLGSSAPQKELRRHLRRFLRARTEDGTRMAFRYYDPRVLRVYLPTLEAQELKTFFGPVNAFAAPEKDPGAFTVYKQDDGVLSATRVEPSALGA
jgi:hypothetical protein